MNKPRTPLNWSAEMPPTPGVCSYDHCTAETPMGGRFLLTWKGWKDYPQFGFDETPWSEVVYDVWGSVVEAKQWAEEELYRRAALCIGDLEGLTKAYENWCSKTDWIQETLQPGELGMHRADAIKARYDNLVQHASAVTAFKHLMSYNDSYFGEPAGSFKQLVYELDRSIPNKGLKAGERQ